jgi:Flp pilus assembly CpaE family ATPase
VNRFSQEVGLNKEMIETALRIDVFHLIPSDYDAVQKALMEGRAIPATSAFGKSMTALSDRLLGRSDPEPAPQSKGSALSGLFSMFSRRR